MAAGTGFTDRLLRSLQPRKKRYDVTDMRRTGLQLRVYPSGKKSFQYRYHFGGQARRLTIGPYPQLTLAEAAMAHGEAERMLARGIDPGREKAAQQAAERNEGTVAELAEEFLSRYVERHRKRPSPVRKMLESNVLPYWGKRKAKDITARDFALLSDRIVDRGSPIMANRVASTVSQMFKFGVVRGLLPSSPCVALYRPGGKETPRERRLTEDEIRQFWERLDTAEMAPASRVGLRLLLATGQRRGELAGAKWSDFDTEARIWRIPAANSKNGKAHEVPLSDLALSLLENLCVLTGQSEWLFPSPTRVGQSIVDRSLSRAVRNNEDHFGLAHFTPHDLRRTCASMMSMLGVPRLHVGKVLNHTDDSITAVYDRHDYAHEKRAALTRWADYLDDILAGKVQKLVPLHRAPAVAHA